MKSKANSLCRIDFLGSKTTAVVIEIINNNGVKIK
jgi:hypothetical protein